MSKAKKKAAKKVAEKIPATAAAAPAGPTSVSEVLAMEADEKPAAKKKSGATFELNDRVEVLRGDYGHSIGPVSGFKGDKVLVLVLPRQPAVAFDIDNLKISQAAGSY